jgi:phage shock protein B
MKSEDLATVALAGIQHSEGVDYTAIIICVSFMLICVALPVWLSFRTKWRAMQAPKGADQQEVQRLWDTARRMEARIGYLETVLDTEVPGWRNRSEMR